MVIVGVAWIIRLRNCTFWRRIASRIICIVSEQSSTLKSWGDATISLTCTGDIGVFFMERDAVNARGGHSDTVNAGSTRAAAGRYRGVRAIDAAAYGKTDGPPLPAATAWRSRRDI